MTNFVCLYVRVSAGIKIVFIISSYHPHIPLYFPYISSYFSISHVFLHIPAYSHIFLHSFHIFLHIFQIFPQVFPSPIRVIFNLLAKPQNKEHVSCLHLAPRFARCFTCGLCLREQESPESSQSQDLGEILKFFQVPEPREKFEIFPSPKAYMEETVRRVTSRTSLRSILRKQAVFEG